MNSILHNKHWRGNRNFSQMILFNAMAGKLTPAQPGTRFFCSGCYKLRRYRGRKFPQGDKRRTAFGRRHFCNIWDERYFVVFQELRIQGKTVKISLIGDFLVMSWARPQKHKFFSTWVTKKARAFHISSLKLRITFLSIRPQSSIHTQQAAFALLISDC